MLKTQKLTKEEVTLIFYYVYEFIQCNKHCSKPQIKNNLMQMLWLFDHFDLVC